MGDLGLERELSVLGQEEKSTGAGDEGGAVWEVKRGACCVFRVAWFVIGLLSAFDFMRLRMIAETKTIGRIWDA